MNFRKLLQKKHPRFAFVLRDGASRGYFSIVFQHQEIKHKREIVFQRFFQNSESLGNLVRDGTHGDSVDQKSRNDRDWKERDPLTE